MSNRYYDFLANRLVDWLRKKKNLGAGDKYFILQDSDSETAQLYEALAATQFSEKTQFSSAEFDYQTIAFVHQGVRVLFAAPVAGVTQDFLVTIRNRVNANTGEWQNTAVFFIVYNALDSIVGGAFDTSQKEAPFNIQVLHKQVKAEIENNRLLNAGKKKALELYLSEIVSNSSTILKDYETVFSILDKGEIERADFNAMGYFPDEALATLPADTIANRLADNHTMFEKVEAIHGDLDVENRLSNQLVGEGLIHNLSQDDIWKETDYGEIVKGVERFKSDKNIDLHFDLNKVVDDDTANWFRVEGQGGPKSKKAHMVLTGAGNVGNSFTFDIFFDDVVNQSSLVDTNTFVFEGHGLKHQEFDVAAKNKHLSVTIEKFNPLATYGGQVKYRHKGVNKLNFDIKFMIVPFPLQQIQYIRPNFKVVINKGAKAFYFGISSEVSPDVNTYDFGATRDQAQTLTINHLAEIKGHDLSGTHLILSDAVYEDENNGSLRVNTRIGSSFFPIEFNDLIPTRRPVLPLDIERKRLGTTDGQFKFEDNKILAGSDVILIEKNYKQRLLIEQQMVAAKSVRGNIIGDEYAAADLALPTSITAAYDNLFDYYAAQNTLPSLAIPNPTHLALLNDVLTAVSQALNGELIEDEKIDPLTANISLIGLIGEDDGLALSPLNPLMIAYQLQLIQQLQHASEVPKGTVLATLNPQYLIPYIKHEAADYQSAYTRTVPRWLFFSKFKQRRLSDIGSNVITQRLNDYIAQYQFLFETNPEMTFNVAAMYIVDEANFFDAVINFMFERLKEVATIDELNPIDLYFDQLGSQINSLFNQLYGIHQIDELNALLNHPYKGSKFEDYEVLEALQKRINVYRIPADKSFADIGVFFHVTFYQFVQQNRIDLSKMDKIDKSYAMAGLLSSPQYHKENANYINGFGTGAYTEKDRSQLVTFATLWNSFIAKADKNTNLYQYGYTLVNNIPQLSNDELAPILDNSSWVTLLDLDVDLSYFFDDANGEMLIIHYTDQSSTRQYESVTVTNDVAQYSRLLHETVFDELSEREDFDVREVIKNFNVINGQWLLRMISDRKRHHGSPQYMREKLSIISAYKELLGILDRPNFYWVPISLEEILRISGMVGLSQKDGIFSSKNLGQAGATSDDLLFIGIENTNGRIKLHYLPVEVKVGNNNATVSKKAFTQVAHTAQILKEFLGAENEDSFMRDYYRNFFVSLLLSNLDKMLSSRIFTITAIPDYQQLKDQLGVGDYDIVTDLEQYYGNGVVFEFTAGATARTAQLLPENNAMLIKVPEQDAYNVVADKTVTVVAKIQAGEFDFRRDLLLSAKQLSSALPAADDEFSPNSSTAVAESSDDELPPDFEIVYTAPESEVISPVESMDDGDTVDEAIAESHSVAPASLEEVPVSAAASAAFDPANSWSWADNSADSATSVAEQSAVTSTSESEEATDWENDIQVEAPASYATEPISESSSEPAALESEAASLTAAVEAAPSSQAEQPSVLGTRLSLGDVLHSQYHAYWEYGHRALANRHMFITGKSGQGKTYFVQRLLAQFADHNINSLVVDYTDGFLPNQLDAQFAAKYHDKIEQRFVYSDKLPINPFKLQDIDLGDMVVQEQPQDMVDRVVQVIDFVFDLGIQQRTLLSETILQGFRANGDSYRFAFLADALRYSEDKSLQNLFGRISTLLTRDPFSYEADFTWDQIFGQQGRIHIFQLKGFQKNIQKVLVEFLLWDFYQYATRKGTKNQPLPIVLDEVQNLDFNNSSPAVKILREGRKFGISGIFATQSLDSIKGNDMEAIYNAAEQIHFLPPDSQVTAIARSVTTDADGRRGVETALKQLHKGEALVYGPIQTANGELSEPRINVVAISSFGED